MKKEANLVNFRKDEVKKVWPLAESYIQEACKSNDGFSAEHILKFLEEGTMQLWMAVDEHNKVLCVCVTEVREYPNYRVCDLRITTGEQYDRWVSFMDQICEWAKQNNCKKMEVFARPGWERILKHQGFKKTHVQIEKKL